MKELYKGHTLTARSFKSTADSYEEWRKYL